MPYFMNTQQQPQMQQMYAPMPVYPGQAMPDNLAMLRQQQQMQPQQQAQMMQQPCLLGRAVSSVEEARAVPSDLSGLPMFFPDLSHNQIHMKIFNPNTGAGDFYTFFLPPPQNQQSAQAAQIALQQPAAAQMRYALADDVDAMRGEIQAIRADVNRTMQEVRRSVKPYDDAKPYDANAHAGYAGGQQPYTNAPTADGQ